MPIELRPTTLYKTDLMLYHCGHEICIPTHSYGPAIRDHFLIHYVVEGSGLFHVNQHTYSIQKGQGFLICPDQITFYEANPEDPWTYYWIGFHGMEARNYLNLAHLSEQNPIFTLENQTNVLRYFKQMVRTNTLSFDKELELMGLLYLFLAELIQSLCSSIPSLDDTKRVQGYVEKAIQYIERNYSRKISVTGIASALGIDRSYLCKLFKETLSKSPQQYLIDYRIHKAIYFMRFENLSLNAIAHSVGYEDPFTFSKTFKKIMGCSPSLYRKTLS